MNCQVSQLQTDVRVRMYSAVRDEARVNSVVFNAAEDFLGVLFWLPTFRWNHFRVRVTREGVPQIPQIRRNAGQAQG